MAQNEWTFELGGSWIDMMRKEYDDKHDADELDDRDRTGSPEQSGFSDAEVEFDKLKCNNKKVAFTDDLKIKVVDENPAQIIWNAKTLSKEHCLYAYEESVADVSYCLEADNFDPEKLELHKKIVSVSIGQKQEVTELYDVYYDGKLLDADDVEITKSRGGGEDWEDGKEAEKEKEKVFSFTGKLNVPKDQLQQIVQSMHGKTLNALSDKVSYLVIDDIESGKAKYDKAKELGIETMTSEAFLKRFGK